MNVSSYPVRKFYYLNLSMEPRDWYVCEGIHGLPLHSYHLAHGNPNRLLRIASDYFNVAIAIFAPECVWKEIDMPKYNRSNMPEMEFVELRLASSDAAKFDTWAESELPNFWGHLQQMGEAGYKLSISPDMDNGCFIATFTGTKHAARNVGKCMTSRAESPVEAAMMALYKHIVICQEGDWGSGTSGKNWG